MPYFAPGVSFEDGVTDQCSADNLHNLLESATVTAIELAAYDSSTSIVFQTSDAAPASDQGDYSYWYDETNDALREKRDGRWDDVDGRPSLTAAEPIMLGSPVRATGDTLISPTASSEIIVGVAHSTAASGADVLVNTFGFHPVLLNGPISRGDPVVSSDVTGWAMSGTFVDGTLEWVSGIDFGLCMGSAATGFSGLVTCFLYR